METGYILNLSLVRSKISWSQFASEHSATVPVLNNTFPGDIFYDQFTLAPAPSPGQGSGGYSQVCQGELCCLFSTNSTSTATSTPTLGVFRGLHTQFGEPVSELCIHTSTLKKIIAGNYFLEICLVTGLDLKQTFNVSVAGVFPHSGTNIICNILHIARHLQQWPCVPPVRRVPWLCHPCVCRWSVLGGDPGWLLGYRGRHSQEI